MNYSEEEQNFLIGQNHQLLTSEIKSQIGKICLHTKRLSQKKRFECDFEGCLKSFARSSRLELHKKTKHYQENLHQCPHEGCIKIFAEKGNLLVHERIHTGEKPFKCSYCEKRFSSIGNCKDHERRHVKARIYNCRLCKASYYRNYQLVKHIQKKHPYSPVKESSVRLTSDQGHKRINLIHGFEQVKENAKWMNENKQSQQINDTLNLNQTLGLKKDSVIDNSTVQKSHSMSINDLIRDTSDLSQIISQNSNSLSLNLSDKTRTTQEQDYSPSMFLVKQLDNFKMMDLQIDESTSEYAFGEKLFYNLNSQQYSSQDDNFYIDDRYFSYMSENYQLLPMQYFEFKKSQ